MIDRLLGSDWAVVVILSAIIALLWAIDWWDRNGSDL